MAALLLSLSLSLSLGSTVARLFVLTEPKVAC